MAKLRTADLDEIALDWAVAHAEGWSPGTEGYADENEDDRDRVTALYMLVEVHGTESEWCPSTDWSLAGPIIERERINLNQWPLKDEWQAIIWEQNKSLLKVAESYGPSALIAAMRCYVASKLGDSVEIPEELL